MELTAFLLVLSGAAVHALWNSLLKRSQSRLAFSVGFIAFQCVVLLPWFAVAVWQSGLEPHQWVWVAASVPLHFGYFLVLLRGYSSGDFSLVYPIARGLAPLLVTLWGMLFAGERPSPLGWAGILAVVSGVLALGSSAGGDTGGRFGDRGPRPGGPPQSGGGRPARRHAGRLEWHNPAVGCAALAALLISGYTLVDGLAARAIGPVVYFYLETAGTLTLLALTAALQGRWAEVRADVGSNWRLYLPVGFMGGLAYILILFAMEQAPLGYVAAARESSILFGLVLSRFFLKERVTSLRVASGAAVVVGLVLLRLS